MHGFQIVPAIIGEGLYSTTSVAIGVAILALGLFLVFKIVRLVRASAYTHGHTQ